MTDQLFIALNDGARIPQVGLGVWQTPNDEAAPAVKAALDAGYRHVDTAAVYENEEGVGKGIRQSGLSRSDIFLTTKLWNNDQGYEQTLKAFEASLKRLGTDYVDLYLIHWPSAHRGLFVDTWKALVKLKEEGRAKSIGVSNFYPEHIEKIVAETSVTPVINQIELHPDFQQRETRAFHEKLKIATQSWSPLGQGKLLDQDLPQIIVVIYKQNGPRRHPSSFQNGPSAKALLPSCTACKSLLQQFKSREYNNNHEQGKKS